MAKGIGCSCLLLAFVLLGQELCRTLRSRRKEQESWYQQMLLLKGEIQYGQTSLPELCLKLGEKEDTRVGAFFIRMGRRLQENRGKIPFFQIWQEEMQPLVQEVHLEEQPLLQLGRNLGSLNRQTELDNLDLYISFLKRQLEQEQRDFSNRIKMVQALTISGGLILVILLL